MNKLSTVALSAFVAGISPVSAAPLAVLSPGLPGGAAVNQVDPTQAAVGIGVLGGCSVRLSGDGGKTWIPAALPQPDGSLPRTYCGEGAPAVLYSADGGRLYAAYAYKYEDPASGQAISSVLISTSVDRGITWSAPVTVVPETGIDLGYGTTELHDIRIAAAPDSSWMYVLETQPSYFGNVIHLVASPDQGASWPGGGVQIAYGDALNFEVLSDRSALAAGAHGVVLVSYGWSDLSGPGSQQWSFVKVARSTDNGATFAATSVGNYSSRNSISLSNPDIKIGPGGTAHVVYDRGRNGVFYNYSYPPYTRWIAFPIGSGVPGSKVSSPRITVGQCGQSGVLSATWLETTGYQTVQQATKLAYTYKVAKNGYRWSLPLKADVPAFLNYLAGVGGNALVVVGGGDTDAATTTDDGTASSGISCR